MTNQPKPRKIATDLLLSIEQGAYAHIALKEVLNVTNLEQLDRAFITELVYGTVRRQNSLDYIINQFLKQKNLRDEIRIILRMGVYQLRYMRVPPSAAVNESVKLTTQYNLVSQKGFVNAVLRNVERARDRDFFVGIKDPVKRISLIYSHPTWIVERMINKFGVEEAIDILEYNNTPSVNLIRVNTLKTETTKLKDILEKEGNQVEISAIPDVLEIRGPARFIKSKTYRQGHFMIQSGSSVLAGLMLDAKPQEDILDACAAPGGKSFVIAQQMNNTGSLISTDIHEHKITLIKKGFGHLGIKNAQAEVEDWTNFDDKYADRFDRVLVDAPCSGLGVLAKRVDARWRKKASIVNELVMLQRILLSNAAKAVKPGGLLMYTTCTLTKEENQDQRAWFLGHFPNFEFSALTDVANLFADESDTLSQGELEIVPSRHSLEGFYMATFIRKT